MVLKLGILSVLEKKGRSKWLSATQSDLEDWQYTILILEVATQILIEL
jgi:hypothetical protein